MAAAAAGNKTLPELPQLRLAFEFVFVFVASCPINCLIILISLCGPESVARGQSGTKFK